MTLYKAEKLLFICGAKYFPENCVCFFVRFLSLPFQAWLEVKVPANLVLQDFGMNFKNFQSNSKFILALKIGGL